MMGEKKKTKTEKLLDDFRNSKIKHSLFTDFKDLKEYYLSDSQKERLARKWWFTRIFYLSWWLLITIFRKLTPARRLLFFTGLLITFFFSNPIKLDVGFNLVIDIERIGVTLIVIVLMLELKDKLLARFELEEGQAVQKALMPDMQPDIPGWETWMYSRPAKQVGGDLVDYLETEESHYGVLVGDVSGKGLKAALLMAKLQTIIRSLAPDCTSLAALGTKVNKIFYRESLPTVFSTLLYLDIRAENGNVGVLNAGHLPPIIYRGGSYEKMPKGNKPGGKGNLALGISAKAEYTSQKLHLEPGDMVLLYSDGLNESRNRAGGFYEDLRMREILPQLAHLSATEAGERLLEDIAEFSKDVKAHDDLSLVLLRRKPV
ncbi:MAG: serine/threonine-protein phosphatase [bacterium]|nr:serine/threonine-protein phosphatase [bacterium]